MLSRVADSVFWMSRYVERAENVARFIDVNLFLTLDLGAGHGSQWAPLVYTTGDHTGFLERFADFTQEQVIEFLAFDPKNPNSILSCLRLARENARTVREMISSAMWEEINKFYLMVSSAAADPSKIHSMFDFFNQVKLSSHLLQGVTDATMSHGEAWHFARIGRLIERADKTSRILDVKYFLLLPTVAEVGTPLDTIQWAALLEIGQRPGNVSPPLRPHPAGPGGRLLDARSAFSPGHALLPDQGRGVAAGDRRRPDRRLSGTGRTASGPAAGRAGLRLHRRDHRARPARIHRSLSIQTELGRRGDLGNVFRRATARRAGPQDRDRPARAAAAGNSARRRPSARAQTQRWRAPTLGADKPASPVPPKTA